MHALCSSWRLNWLHVRLQCSVVAAPALASRCAGLPEPGTRGQAKEAVEDVSFFNMSFTVASAGQALTSFSMAWEMRTVLLISLDTSEAALPSSDAMISCFSVGVSPTPFDV